MISFIRIAAVAILLFACEAAFAADARTFAIVSLIGDQFTIVQRESATGSNIRRNQRKAVRFDNAVIDREAIVAADEALQKARGNSGALAALVVMRDASVLAAQERMLEVGADLRELIPAVRAGLADKHPSHVILIAKYRADARIPVKDGSVGDGRIDGVGFYLDPTYHGDVTYGRPDFRGFIAPFAYFQVALIDMERREILGKEVATAAFMRTNEHAESLTPWDLMSAAEKMEALEDMVARETARMIAAVLAKL